MLLYRLVLVVILFASGTIMAQETKAEYLERLNATLPHQFKELNTGATMEAVRTKNEVHLYLLVDDVTQYEQLLIERSDEMQQNFSQCKLIDVATSKFDRNYIEAIDRFPVSSRMTNVYRLKAITPEGIVRMFAPIAISH